MKRTPRRKRARLWAWVYLAVFGPDEDGMDESEPGSTAAEQDDGRDDVNSPEV